MLRWRDRSKIDQSFDQACRTSVALLPYPREEQESAEYEASPFNLCKESMANVLTGRSRRTGPLGSSRDLGESVDDSSLPLLNGHDRDKDSTEDEQGKIAPLGASQQEKRFWFQRDHTYDPDAIATQVSKHHHDGMIEYLDLNRRVSSTTPKQQRSICLDLTGQ